MNSDIRDLHNRDLESILVENLENATGRLFNDRYVGIVVDNNDPKKQARIKVRVMSVHTEEIPDDMLPWAYLGDVGNFTLPRIGEKVHIRFDSGNRYVPYWTDIFIPSTQLPSKMVGDELIDSQYPDTVVLFEDETHSITYDRTTGAKHFYNVKFGHLIIDKDGNVIIGDVGHSGEVNMQLGRVNANISTLKLPGTVIPDLTGSGPLCAIRFCPLNGVPHVGDTSINSKPNDVILSVIS